MIDQQKSQKHELDLQILKAVKLQYFKKNMFFRTKYSNGREPR